MHLKGLTNLSELDLNGTHVTDAGLAHLKGLTKIASLYLTTLRSPTPGWYISKAWPTSRMLYLYGTRVTDAGINELKQALPSLTIVR